METLFLKGFIRDATYTPYLNPEKFEEYDVNQFDVNQGQAYSWMNLLNIYIILAWYEDAERKPGTTDRITNQILNVESVREKLFEVSGYQMTALHWNTTHFEKDFESI